jgi:hypothetical protein
MSCSNNFKKLEILQFIPSQGLLQGSEGRRHLSHNGLGDHKKACLKRVLKSVNLLLMTKDKPDELQYGWNFAGVSTRLEIGGRGCCPLGAQD